MPERFLCDVTLRHSAKTPCFLGTKITIFQNIWGNVDAVVYDQSRSVCLGFRALIAGGGAPEIELALRLAEHSQTLAGKKIHFIWRFSHSEYLLSSSSNPYPTPKKLRKVSSSQLSYKLGVGLNVTNFVGKSNWMLKAVRVVKWQVVDNLCSSYFSVHLDMGQFCHLPAYAVEALEMIISLINSATPA